MNFSELFIRRPIATTLIMVGVLVAGIMAYRLLPVADLPTVDYPTIQVSASLPGASPETMAASVATPLEKQFSIIAGLDSMTSVNSLGTTRVVLQFKLERNIDAAAQDVQSAIAAAQRGLPTDMPSPPSYRKVNPSDSPIFYLAVSSATMRLSDVNEYAENFIAQRLSSIDGVALINVYGSQKYAVRVQVDPQALAAKKIGIDEVAGAIKSGNSNLAVGTLNGPDREYTLQSSGKLMDAAAYRPLIVSWRNGAPVRLEELATVLDSVENDRRRSWYSGKPAMILAVQRQPGTNTVEVVDRIRNTLSQMESQIPAAIELTILSDSSKSIRESVHDVKFTMGLTVCLVILVIFMFLRNISATIIPSLAVPLSIVGACGVMYMSGFSLNNLSLMALTLSVGFVVDDAIVMLENIVRHMEMGKTALKAALDGSKEIGFTILSMTISLTAVFIPVLFMGGIVGRLFHEFAVTIAAAILVSGCVSLTLTPMMCSRFLRSGGHGERQEGVAGKAGRIFGAAMRFYEITLKGALRHRFLMLLFSFGVIGLTGWLFMAAPKGFLPFTDTGDIMGSVEGLQGSSIAAMTEHQLRLSGIIQQEPSVEGYMSVVGAGGPQAFTNTGTVFIRLKPKSERRDEETVGQVIARLRTKMGQVPGVRVFLTQPPPIRVGGASSRSLYQFTLQSPNTADLYAAATAFYDEMTKIPGLRDVSSDLLMSNPELRIGINRSRASAMGISAAQIEDALASSFSTRQVSTILAPTNDYPVILELAPRYQRDPAALNFLYVRSQTGQLVPLSTLVDMDTGVGPMSINHSGQMPSVTISFNLNPGVALGQAVDAVRTAADNFIPASVSTRFQGTAQAFQDSMGGLWLLLLMAVVVIYIVLGILYESFIHPLTILSGLPAAGVGAVATLMIFGKDLDIYGFVGIIMLIGIVKKNAIMMIDFALESQRKHNIAPAQAICDGALVRFRPIMMTTLAALMGTLPIAVGYGAGGEARQPLGLAVVGGLLVSQLLTLYLTPVYYTYLDSLQNAFRRLFHIKSKKEAEA